MSHTGTRLDFWGNMIGSGDPRAGSFDYWDGSDPSCECDEVTPDALGFPEGCSSQIPPQSSQPKAKTSALGIQHPDVSVPETIHPSCLSNASDSPPNQNSHRSCPPCLALYPACDSLSCREDNPSLLPVDSELSCLERSEYSRDHSVDSVAPNSVNGRSPFPEPIAPFMFSTSSQPPTLLHSSAQAGPARVMRVPSCFDPTPISPPPTRAPPPSRPPYAAELLCTHLHLFHLVEEIARVRARMARTLGAVECALSRSGFPAHSIASLPPSHHGARSGCSSEPSSRSRAHATSRSACITPCCSSALVDDERRSPRCSRDDGSARDSEDSQLSSSATFTPAPSPWTYRLELDSEMGGGMARALIMNIGQQIALRVHPTSTSTRHRARASESPNPSACTLVCASSRTRTHQRCWRYRSRSRYPDRRSPRAGERIRRLVP